MMTSTEPLPAAILKRTAVVYVRHTNPIKVIWLTIGRHVPGSDLVVSDFNVSRNGEASGMTLSVQHVNRSNDDGNREEAMAFARALCREFGVEGPMEG